MQARVVAGKKYTEYMLLLKNDAVDVYRHVLRASRVEAQEDPAGSTAPPGKENAVPDDPIHRPALLGPTGIRSINRGDRLQSERHPGHAGRRHDGKLPQGMPPTLAPYEALVNSGWNVLPGPT